MPEKMKLGVMEGIKQMNVREVDIPQPGNKEVLVKIHNCNICTTDWQTWAGLRKSQGRKFPWAPGHEMSGEIVSIGEGANPKLKVGMRVGFGSQTSRGCGECIYCRKGHPSRCQNKPQEVEIAGIKGSFGMSQYLIYDSTRIYLFRDDLPYEIGAFLEPVATAVHGVRRLRLTHGDKVLVIGAGNLGLINAQVARSFGANVIVSEVNENRISLSESLGFTTINPSKANLEEEILKYTNGRGCDAVILAVANNVVNDQAIKALAIMGKVLFLLRDTLHRK